MISDLRYLGTMFVLAYLPKVGIHNNNFTNTSNTNSNISWEQDGRSCWNLRTATVPNEQFSELAGTPDHSR